jgi:hypothetical protein
LYAWHRYIRFEAKEEKNKREKRKNVSIDPWTTIIDHIPNNKKDYAFNVWTGQSKSAVFYGTAETEPNVWYRDSDFICGKGVHRSRVPGVALRYSTDEERRQLSINIFQ